MRDDRATLLSALALSACLVSSAPAAPPGLLPAPPIRACGTVELGPPALAPDPETFENWKNDPRLASGGQIPVYFHVIDDGTEGDVPDVMLREQIQVLNRSYAGMDLEGNAVAGAPNTGYAFVLAGIDRHLDLSWFRMTPSSKSEIDAKNALAIDPRGALNIYVCEPGEGLLGWGTLPWSLQANTPQDGVVVHYGTLPRGGLGPFGFGGTTVHEVGHYLGLYHTFQGGCHSDASCSTAGDLVCDTPPEAVATAGCPDRKDTCTRNTGVDPIHNYMDYSEDGCYESFTRGQDQRMKLMMARYRPWIAANLPALPGERTGTRVPVPVPTPRAVLHASPNPFNPTTTIEFFLPGAARVSLQVHDVAGRAVATLVDGSLAAGEHRAVFEARGLASGVYFVLLRTADTAVTERLVLLQ